MPNTSIDGFSVLSPSQKKELERQRQEKEARQAAEAAQKAEAARKAKEAEERNAHERRKASQNEMEKLETERILWFFLIIVIIALIIATLIIWWYLAFEVLNDEDPIERHGDYIMVGLLHMFWMSLIVLPVVGALGVGISGCIRKIEDINKKYKSAEAKLKE